VCPFAVVTAMAITKATEFKLKLHSAILHLQAEDDPVLQRARAAEHVAVCTNFLDGAQITVAEKNSLLQLVVSLLEVWQCTHKSELIRAIENACKPKRRVSQAFVEHVLEFFTDEEWQR
jgi:hypothetical protein